MIGGYWFYVLTAGLVVVVVMQSLGVISGRAGVISLCQMSFAGIGAWVMSWCNFHDIPGGFMVWALISALAAVPAGLLVGFPALRLRGVTLAIATFAFAAAVDVLFNAASSFPGTDQFEFVTPPAPFDTEVGYFVLVAAIVTAVFVGLRAIDRTRLGAAWVEVRYSERGAAAHGINVALAKLAAFAVGAFIAGLAGALMVGLAGSATPANFVSTVSIFYFSIAIILGVHNWEAALLGGVLGALLPVLLDSLGLRQDLGAILFGVLAVHILAQSKGQMGHSDILRLRRRAKKLERRPPKPPTPAAEPTTVAPATTATAATATALTGTAATALTDGATTDGATDGATATTAVPSTAGDQPSRDDQPAGAATRRPGGGPPVLEVTDLTVTFGAVRAVDEVSLTVPGRTVLALVGPNGAGKSTLVNAITGFVGHGGTVRFGGRNVDRLAPHRRARIGIRRSFQQLRVPPGLTVGMYLRSAAGRHLTAAEVDDYLAWFGCPAAEVPIASIDVGTRRILEVAGLAAGRPALLLLDEPAAGQDAEERRRLGERIAAIPARTGSAVVLVEHDIDLVRSICEVLVVMDGGRVLAAGAPDTVLSDPAVIRAYLGSAAAPAAAEPQTSSSD